MKLIFFYLSIVLLINNPSSAFFERNEDFVEIDGQNESFLSFFIKESKESKEANNIWINANNLFVDKKYRKAGNKFKELYQKWPNHQYAVRAVELHADTLRKRKKWNEAFEVYQFCIDNYSNRISDYNVILENQYAIAISVMNHKRMSFIFNGYSTPELAIPLFEAIVRNGPQWKETPHVLFMIAKCNQDAKKYEEAILSYTKLFYRFPNHDLAEESFWKKIECLTLLKEMYPVNPEIQQRVLTATTMYLSTFTKSEKRNKIIALRNNLYEGKAKKIFDQGDFYERVPKDKEAAILVYESMIEDFPKSKLVELAKSRINSLKKSK